MRKPNLLGIMAAGMVMSLGMSATAQTLVTGRTAADNASAAGARAPGNMVSAGVGRAQGAAQQGRSTHSITEELSTTAGPQRQFLIESAMLIVDQVSQMITFLTNRFLAQQGIDPALLSAFTAATSGSLGDLLGGLGIGEDTTTDDNTGTTVDDGATVDDSTSVDDGGRGGRGERKIKATQRSQK